MSCPLEGLIDAQEKSRHEQRERLKGSSAHVAAMHMAATLQLNVFKLSEMLCTQMIAIATYLYILAKRCAASEFFPSVDFDCI